MRESYTLKIKEMPETEQVINRLRDVLAVSGIELEYFPVQNSIKFNFDTSAVQEKATRHAGRKRKTDDLRLTVGEVKEMLQRSGPKEIWEMLGISKATFYRRMKQMEEKSDNDWFME